MLPLGHLWILLTLFGQGAITADVHVTSAEIADLFHLERVLLARFGDDSFAEDLIAFEDRDPLQVAGNEVSILIHSPRHFQFSPIDHPLNVFYLYHHWLTRGPSLARRSASRAADEARQFRSQLPSEKDVRGVADHIFRLCRVYNISGLTYLGWSICRIPARYGK